MVEVWKRVIYQGKDYGDFYEVSNLGNIRNAKTHKVRSLNILQTGYYFVSGSLGSRSDKITFKVHKAVAESFIPNHNGYPCVNHIDGNKLNNSVDNLEWCTYKENSQHASKLGLITQEHNKGSNNSRSKSVLRFDNEGNVVKYGSLKEAARVTVGDKVGHHVANHISECCRGKRDTCCGYRWEFA